MCNWKRACVSAELNSLYTIPQTLYEVRTVFYKLFSFHIWCVRAKLVGSNTNVYASTFQRKVYIEISVHSLPSQFRPEQCSLLQRTGSWNCAECAADNCEYNTIPTMYAVKHNRMPCTGYESHANIELSPTFLLKFLHLLRLTPWLHYPKRLSHP